MNKIVLDVGAGPASQADIQIDVTKFPKTTYVMDAMMDVWPVDDESVDEVRMEQFLEHCPVVVKYKDVNNLWKSHYPAIHCMGEAYGVLKHGGILHCSVPSTQDTHSQDPTHCGPMWIDGRFNYFCGQWGGNEPGSFANDSYGINFAFKKLTSEMTGFILTVRMMKP